MNALAKPPPLPNTQERGRELLRSLRKNITILIGFRIVLLCTTLLSATFVTFRAQTSEQKLLFVYLPIAALLLFSVLSIWWARTRETKSSFVYLQLISCLLYTSPSPRDH